MSKAATDKMTCDMAVELREYGIAAQNGWLNISNCESPEFIGRVVAALSIDPGLIERSGCVLVAAQVARELGVTDTSGKQPQPLTLETA